MPRKTERQRDVEFWRDAAQQYDKPGWQRSYSAQYGLCHLVSSYRNLRDPSSSSGWARAERRRVRRAQHMRALTPSSGTAAWWFGAWRRGPDRLRATACDLLASALEVGAL